MALSDTMVVMNEGKIEQSGPPQQVYNQPRSEFVARFIGGHNILKNESGTGCVRSDRMGYSIGGDATVKNVEYLGHDVRLTIDSPHGQVVITARENDFNSTPCNTGDSISLHWAPDDLHLFNQSNNNHSHRSTDQSTKIRY